MAFSAAFSEWQALAARYGPARAYRPALQLPELARTAGADARRQADWAVGSTLFWMGRFADARRWLAPGPELGWTLALQGEREAALAQPDTAVLHFFLDAPEACLARLVRAAAPANRIAAARADLLRYWAHARLQRATDERAAQAALALLRREAPCDEARGMAVYAEAAFRQEPVSALPHLDHALDLFARFGLHYLEARLLDRKAQALDAAGHLGDASRLQRATAAAERRQRP